MEKCGIKKRGRKPKGGKIIDSLADNEDSSSSLDSEQPVQNVILHLKCFKRELDDLPSTVIAKVSVEPYCHDTTFETISVSGNEDALTIQDKLKQLSAALRCNNISKKSACFWCTCNYDTPTIYIPKNKVNGQYQVYGSFCSPQCAAAYVFTEPIDHATKFERYHLLNFMYGSAYSYTRNILPAPSPYYILDKFYGNLTADEYRKLLQTDQLVMVLDKPICVTCPDIVQSNRNFVEKVGVEVGYRLCRKKKQEV